MLACRKMKKEIAFHSSNLFLNLNLRRLSLWSKAAISSEKKPQLLLAPTLIEQTFTKATNKDNYS